MADPGGGPRALWLSVILSVAFHLLVVNLRLEHETPEFVPVMNDPIEISEVPAEWLQPKPPSSEERKPKPIEDSKTPQMAETEAAEPSEEDPNARFLSDRNQKAEKQTKAKVVDDFRGAQGTGGKGLVPEPDQGLAPSAQSGADNAKEEPLEDGEIPGVTAPKSVSGVKRDWKTLSLKDLSVGGDGGALAATDDRLDGVAEGERTILSTREFRYFSYYHRIKELLRQYWKPMVETKLVKIWGKGRNVSSDEMVTRVLVLLNKDGSIQKISRLASSGFTELDDAAVESFHKAGPFPNPPRGIIEDDGFVRIRWDFILKTESAPRIQFQSAGAAGGGSPLDR